MSITFNKTRSWLFQLGSGAVGVGLGLFLGWLAVRGVDLGQIVDAFADVAPLAFVAAVALLLLSGYLRAFRWRLLWTNHRVTTLRLFFVENAALGLNNISPIRAMDEALEFGLLTFRDRLPSGTVVATMMMCRVLDLTFTLLFIAAAVLLLPALLRFAPAIVFTALFLLAWLAILLSLGRILRRFPRLRRIAPALAFEQAVSALWRQPKRLGVVFAISGAYWLLLAPLGWVLAREVGIDLPFHLLMVAVLGAIFFATAVPGLPGAVGTFEFAAVSLLDLWGVPQGPAVTFAIILHAVLFIPPTAIAVAVLPREGVGSLKSLRSLLRRWRQVHEP